MGCSEARMEKTREQAKRFTLENQFRMYAAIHGNKFSDFEDLLNNGYLINMKMPTFSSKTCLHIAAEFGREDILELLLAKGAEINAQDTNLLTPIFYAVKNRQIECAVKLDMYGADLNVVSLQGLKINDYVPKGKEKYFSNLLKINIKKSALAI